MTNYKLPTTAQIGDVKYYNGDLVWFNGVIWEQIVLGTKKLDKLSDTVVNDEKLEAEDVTELQSQINSLVFQLQELKSRYNLI